MGQLSQNFGKINQTNSIEQGVSFNSERHFGSIQFYKDSIARVRLSSGVQEEKHSYATIQKPEAISIQQLSTNQTLQLESRSLTVDINLETAKISFSNQNQQKICSDCLPTSWLGTEVTTYKTLQKDEKFVGLGEKTGPLNRRGHAYVNWNTDKFAYDIEQDPLYLTAPFYIGIHNGLVYGIFFDNTHKTTFNFGASTERFAWFSAESGEMDYYFIYGNSIAEIISDYTWLTGRMKLPPLWSLGFQQCRYSYYPDSEVYQLGTTFRDKQIPCDVIYLDIHYMEDYKAFTFDNERFPKPKTLVNTLKTNGFKTAIILDPGIKVQKGYAQYDSGIEEDIFVKYPDGERYIGEVWPGRSHFPDFTAAKTRDWWGRQMPFYTELGIKGFWNDMNEPAAWGQCLPNHLEFEFEGEWTSHREARNVYGMQMARSTAEGVKNQLDNERPFVLTRAGYAGIQRYSAVWTGDNVSSDEHLMLGVRLVNSLGLTGISFCGNDTGGFAGEASPALYARWISIGAFQPFFRAHSVVNSRDAEPWSFGEEVEQIARNYIGLRYQLMPYIYSLIWESTQNGLPMNRSLVFDYPHDEKTYLYQHQFTLGKHLLIAPVESDKDFVKVWLPQGLWYNFWTGDAYQGDSELIVECPVWKLPIFVKAGAVIPMRPICQHLDDAAEELILHVYAGGNGSTSLYEDDGLSYNYEDGAFAVRSITLQDKMLTIGALTGDFLPVARTISIVFHGQYPEAILVNGQWANIEKRDIQFVQPITGIDTFYTDKGKDMKEENLTTITLDYNPNEMIIKW